MEFLRKAKKHGKYLIVALEPDETIIKYKKCQPIHNQLQRAKILSSFTFVDKVLILPKLKDFNDYARVKYLSFCNHRNKARSSVNE
ncbi:hypothetical protein NBT09_07520 [Rickettsia conorii subsp. raoultii]|uniref:Acyl-[acyl-carrier-protein]--UDP-N-acetylglucosamine O-acyltransferase n=1 Tax=Rickettsia conorii subsp. raoultii TaxID=369822 RepID=A0ABY4U1I9_RICCR|nr:hypothetical protein [Rickettsia conorii]URW78494.1 hypothetical protein NBT09_07520 [Rickettsia conorii subsp. raoultii]